MGRINIVGTTFVLWLNVSSERISATEFWLEIKKDRFATALKPNSIIRISRKYQLSSSLPEKTNTADH